MSIFEPAQRLAPIKPSPTIAITTLAKRLKAEGKDVIGLGAGEPDFPTPEHIQEAAKKAMRDGHMGYTAVDGIPQLKQACVDKMADDHGLDYALSQILVSVGGKQSFYNLCQAYLNPGDEVIVPAPYWVSYPDMAMLAGAVPVFIETGREQQYKLNAEQLAQAITEKTRLVVLNSPSNPTGQVYSREELQALGEVLLRHPHILVATDDMYEKVLFEGEFVNIAMACPELVPQTMVLNGVSKAYAMTGWRIGYAAGPESLIKAMKTVQSQSTSNPTTVSQYAALAALTGDQQCVTQMLGHFKQRHDFVHAALNEIDGVTCLPSQGTFYSFADVEEWIKKLGLADDNALASHLIDSVGVALVPGSAFGCPDHIRISYATSMELLESALSRLASLG